jgi:hypothetical protein
MESGSRQAKSTGYTPPIKAGKGKGLAPVESTAKKSVSPVLITAPMKDASLTSVVEVSASNILAVQVVMGDFKELKAQLPTSWQASSKGKIYWCADFTGHTLQIVDGNLLVDGKKASELLEKLLQK